MQKQMSIAVPYLSEYEIECAASLLLREVGLGSKRYCTNIVPVESILERHLKLSLDFDDLHTKLGVPISDDGPEILGAIWIESREVFIDQSLDPDANPAMEGRFRFTVGHEIGHWCLHRDYIQDSPAEKDLFGAVSQRRPTVVCRAFASKEPIEWQADTFASCLLMPAPLVHHWWREVFSRSGPLIYDLFKSDSDWAQPPSGWRESTTVPALDPAKFDPVSVSYFFYRASRELAPRFGVSIQAMQIRLQKLGLLLLERPHQASTAI
jgi:IrrE N-terminal-like domain